MTAPVQVVAAPVRDPRVLSLLDALTAELATAGSTPEQTFGYSADKLERAGVHLVTAEPGGRLVGVGGADPALIDLLTERGYRLAGSASCAEGVRVGAAQRTNGRGRSIRRTR